MLSYLKTTHYSVHEKNVYIIHREKLKLIQVMSTKTP